MRGRAGKGITDVLEAQTPTAGAVDVAYDAARALAPKAPVIAMPESRAAIAQWAQGRAPGAALADIEKKTNLAMKQSENLLNNQATTFKDIVNQFDRIGTLVGEKGGWTGSGKIKHLWRSFARDFENVADTHPAAAAVRDAATVFKTRAAMLDLDEGVRAALKLAPGKAAGDRLVKGLDAAKPDLPPAVYDMIADSVQVYLSKPTQPIGKLTGLFMAGTGYGLGPAAAASMLVPHVVWDALRSNVSIHPVTKTIIAAGYQGARRLAVEKRREAMAVASD